MKSKKKDKHYSNNRKYICLGLMLFILTAVLVEPTYCAITDETMKSIGEHVKSTVTDWTIIGLMALGSLSVILIAITQYKAAIGCGAAFLFGGVMKIWASKGAGALLISASQFL